MAWLWVGAGAFLGANLRHQLGLRVAARWASPFPWATLAINASGSFALGLLVGALGGRAAPEWRLFVGVGLLGGYTTFSAYAVETLALLEAGHRTAACLYFVGSPLASVAAALLGLLLGRGRG